jgi:hypothetical protein
VGERCQAVRPRLLSDSRDEIRAPGNLRRRTAGRKGSIVADQASCGQGLAANAVLPAKLGELTAALAGVLDTHTKALDLDDEDARRERDAYLQLADEQRQTAAQLLATSEEMAGYQDLPVARHDPIVMASAEVADTFEKFVNVEHELLALLQGRVEQDRAMLLEMGRQG